ncbi:Uncharacterized protein GBIM_18950 [Gryllus bimaculatus]|nr:Uncharacterized protein GBIM_18950 [Gryllus bimaculatus]
MPSIACTKVQFPPRPHEAGGVFGQGPVVRRWRMGSAVPVRVELTANHRGYFEFRLCARDRPQPEATQACLDAHLLRRAPAPGGPAAAARRVAAASASGSALEDEGEERAGRFFPEAGANRVFEMRYLLPPGVVCERCVLQWRYVAGNSWGRCENGTEAVGCGPQEEFRACADVAIDGQGERPTEAPAPAPGEGPTEGAGEGEGEGEGESEGAGEGERPPTAEEHRGRAWWAALVIVVASALAAAATLLLLYVYYYHAADVLKSWLRGRRAAAAAANGDYVS